eukprot:g4145.t1
MVRQFRCQTTFPSCTPQEFFDAIYADEVSMKLYLKLNTLEGAFSVSRWNENTRVVQFTKQFNLPATVAAFIGSSTLPFKDYQQLNQHRNGEFTISSSPVLQLSTGNRFRTWTELSARLKDKDCVVDVAITCEVEGPGGASNIIELLMEKESKSGIGSFLTFCETRLADLRSEPSIPSGGGGDETNEQRLDFRGGIPNQETTQLQPSSSNQRIDDEVDLAPNGIERILSRIESVEETASVSQQRALRFAVLGTSVLSFIVGASMIARKRGHDEQ